jgi:superfamily II DNA or RNA helicase
MESALRQALLGPYDGEWSPPRWLKRHQVEAARRVRGSLLVFGTALLADAVGLGKTYMALAVASLYTTVVVVPPAALRSQWQRVSTSVGIDIQIVTQEALSRGRRIGTTDLVVLDEAHRLRNPNTRRYDSLARSIGPSHLLLITATPVVNSSTDLLSILRLGLPDNAFASLGLPSLERAVASGEHQRVSSATASAIVARSPKILATPTICLPELINRPVVRLPTATEPGLDRVLRSVDELEFPCVGDTRESALLRLHLLYRIASSIAAGVETTRRHLSYINRAIMAAKRGELLTRYAARQIFASEYELQLELDDLNPTRGSLDMARLREEQGRLEKLLAMFPDPNASSPKAEALAELLIRRDGHKTIVFTSAVATALHLARLLRWQRVAVVGAGRARIASGPIPVEDALSAFAPIARGAPDPPDATQVLTLLATDLASEGLNLQDASAVVHYDLPWTPVRLEQRIGRVARLGSSHTTAEIFWFAPPKPVELRLNLEARIARKVRCQMALSVPATTQVGSTGLVNEMLELRERVGCAAPRSDPGPTHAVVHGPMMALLAVSWTFDNRTVPELILLGGDPLITVRDYSAIDGAIQTLVSAENSRAEPPVELVRCLLGLVRARFVSMDRGPCNQTVRRLVRRVVKRAYWEGRRRNTQLVDLLDIVLNRLRMGVSIGGERSLQRLLDLITPPHALRDWLQEQPTHERTALGFKLIAAIFGDGSVPACPNQSSPSTGNDFSS